MVNINQWDGLGAPLAIFIFSFDNLQKGSSN